MAGAKEVTKDAAGELSRGLLFLRGFAKKPQGRQGFPVYPLGVKNHSQLEGQGLNLGLLVMGQTGESGRAGRGRGK